MTICQPRKQVANRFRRVRYQPLCPVATCNKKVKSKREARVAERTFIQEVYKNLKWNRKVFLKKEGEYNLRRTEQT